MNKTSLQECYNVLQDNCGIKAGNTVKVLRIAKDFEMGWENVWEESMDDKVGNTDTVNVIQEGDGFFLSDGYYYPFFVLEKIKDVKILEATMQEVENKFGCKVKIIKEI